MFTYIQQPCRNTIASAKFLEGPNLRRLQHAEIVNKFKYKSLETKKCQLQKRQGYRTFQKYLSRN